MKSDTIVFILGAGIATYLTRFPLLILAKKKDIPKGLLKYMGYIAPAILTALITPAIFIKQGKLDLSFSNTYIFAAIITSLVAYFTKNMLISVITGVCSVGLLALLIR
jgi:branched-subunit amino acid transport protein